MGWSTTVVAPPDGDMGDYLASLRKLLTRDDEILWPTHGGPVRDPKNFIAAYLAHRLEREQQILESLRQGASAIPQIVDRIYIGLDPRLKPAAGLSVLAHLLQLVKQNRVARSGEPGFAARYRVTS
jgi:glyoxylase-like metal-dependent hydrolase (beta-lactamase superfamily II)